MEWPAILEGSKETVTSLVGFLTSGAAVLMGSSFIYSGFSKMVAHSKGQRHGQPTAGPVAINLLIGAIMVQLSFMVDQFIVSMFGAGREDPNAAMSYMPSPVKDNVLLQQAVNAAVLWVYAIGFIAIFRGLVQWNALASGRGSAQDNGWKGFWHIFFGALAVNLTGFLRVLTSN